MIKLHFTANRQKSLSKLAIICNIILTCIISFSLVLPAAAGKLTRPQLEDYNKNGIYFFNPTNTISSCIIGVGSWDGLGSNGLYPSQAAFVDMYHDIAAQLSVEFGIPWEAVMAQGILESASGTSNFAIYRNNFFGIGAVDSNPGNAAYFETPMAGWRGYYEFIRDNQRYRNHGAFSGENITNPYSYIQAIKNAGYATDVNYVSKVSRLINGIINRAKDKGWALSSELASLHPEMLANAATNAAGANIGSIIGSDASFVNAVCISEIYNITNSNTGVVLGSGNGDINGSALELAWPTKGEHGKDEPTQAYRTMLQQIGFWSDTGNAIAKGAACDRFVSAVMYYSGVDPNYPKGGGVASQYSYLSSSSLYQSVQNIGNTSNLQPGDILVKTATGNVRGHIQIYVQRGDGRTGVASASYDERTGEVGSVGSISGYKIYRFIGESI